MDITKLTQADLSYMEGFVGKCAELGIDPELALKQAAGCCEDCKCDAKPPKTKDTAKAKGADKPAKKGGKLPFGGKAAPLFQKKSQDMAQPEPEPKKSIMGGAGKGALVGGGIGALGGGAVGALGAAGISGMDAPSRLKLVAALKMIAAGAIGGAAGGAASGAVTGGVMRAVQ